MKKIESLDAIIVLLKAMAEANRLRVLRLLYHEDLTVSDFIFILGQSQLRISRHLRLLYEAQLVESYQKGGAIYFKLCDGCLVKKNIVIAALSSLPERNLMLMHDLARLMDVKKQRRKRGKKYFLQNIAQRDALRLSYIADHLVESALREMVGDKPFDTMLDIGTGAGSVSKLLSDLYTHAIEVKLDSDILHLSVGNTTFDLVVLHWVLHFFDSPEIAFNEVAGVLRPHGRLLIVDFVHHKVVSSHSSHAHMPLDFSDSQIAQWLKNAGLILEKMISLPPLQDENNEGFIVKLWLARDPRLLVDDIKDKKIEFA
ncbi:ArsR/SmtB family transcription factor [Bartonella gliris]|uniref:ArsR/SmtB family transcription factor n=1 Tax=Bartonella gliris TaxID=3004109 RepID=UPI00295EC6D0|nr:metalloregulator ArsR/SmtB family transcription factor [Bartonella gliris]